MQSSVNGKGYTEKMFLYSICLIEWRVIIFLMKQELIQKEPIDGFGRDTILLGVKETLLN